MFLLFGASSKAKFLGTLPINACPVCGRLLELGVYVHYCVFDFFFIPLFRYRVQYMATCRACNSVLELRKEKGKQMEMRSLTSIEDEDFIIRQDNRGLRCPHCGQPLYPGQVYCGYCGKQV